MNKSARRFNITRWIPLFLGIVLLMSVLLPLLVMFLNLDGDDLKTVFADDSFAKVVGNSVIASLLTTVISMVMAFTLAICIERSAIPCKRIIRILATLPMLVPSLSIGMGAILLGGNNGLLTNLLGITSSRIYGLPGIIWGSVMYSFPVAFLMFSNVLRYEDSTPYDAAEILGISPIHRFFSITLPYLRKPMISIAFSVFTLSFTDYGVPFMIGGKFKTLPLLMYEEVIGRLDFGKGCVYGIIMLVPAVIAFMTDYVNHDTGNASFVTKPFLLKRNVLRDVSAGLVSGVLTLFSILPIASFAVLAFVRKYPSDMSLTLSNFRKTLQANGGQYLLNSLFIALAVALLGTLLCIFIAYFTARIKRRLILILHLIAMSTASVPGIVLGLSYVLTFKPLPIYGTMVILVMVNIVHFLSSPYLMMYAAFSKINSNMESVAATLGIKRLRLLFEIMLSGCKNTVGEMFSYFFVNSMMTISAVSFLANTRNKPIALMINQYQTQSQMEYAAVVSLLILFVNVIIKIIFERKQKE